MGLNIFLLSVGTSSLTHSVCLCHISAVSAIVEHDYTAKEAGELNLVKGAIIQNIKLQSNGWWEGQLASGKTGLFRETFVRLLGAAEDQNNVVLR